MTGRKQHSSIRPSRAPLHGSVEDKAEYLAVVFNKIYTRSLTTAPWSTDPRPAGVGAESTLV